MSHLAIYLTSTEGMSRGRFYITLFVQHPQIGSAYVTEGKITQKYRSKNELPGKERLRLIGFNFVKGTQQRFQACPRFL